VVSPLRYLGCNTPLSFHPYVLTDFVFLFLLPRGGMIAPMLGGTLLMINRSIPVYTSVVIFAFAGICVLLLQEDVGEGGKGDGERVLSH
jgi:hypothetical protein